MNFLTREYGSIPSSPLPLLLFSYPLFSSSVPPSSLHAFDGEGDAIVGTQPAGAEGQAAAIGLSKILEVDLFRKVAERSHGFTIATNCVSPDGPAFATYLLRERAA